MPIKSTPALLRSRYHIIAAVIACGVLVLHDSILYPHLGAFGVLKLAGLRFLLLFIPLVATVLITSSQGWRKWLSGAVWLLFIPYALYSLLEVRHIAEICRIPVGYFTQVCSEVTWQVIPSFLYGLLGLVVFIWSAHTLTSRQPMHVVILSTTLLTFYSAFAAVFGIFARINIWELIIYPLVTLTRLTSLVTSVSAFWINVLVIWALFSLVTVPIIIWKRVD